MKIYCGVDWAEAHHDVAVIDDTGRRLAKTRITDDLPGFTALSRLLADAVASAQPPESDGGFVSVDVAIETDAVCWSRRYARPGIGSGRSTPRRSTGTATGTPPPEPSPTPATR